MQSEEARSRSVGAIVLCFLACMGIFAMRWLANEFAFPLFASFDPLIKDVAVGANALTLAAVAIVAASRPIRVSIRAFSLAVVGALAAGAALVALGLAVPSQSLLGVGAALLDAAGGLVIVMACLSCLQLTFRGIGLCVAGAYACVYALRVLGASLPPAWGLALYAAVPFATLLAGYVGLRSALERGASLPMFRQGRSSGAGGEDVVPAPLEMAVTQPASFLSFRHEFYLALFLLQLTYGFAMTFNSFNEAGSATVVCLGAFVLLALAFAPRWLSGHADWLFLASILLVLAGMLCYFVPTVAAAQARQMLLSVGSGFFSVLAFFFLVALGKKNQANAPVVTAWSLALMSVGVMVGAALARASRATSASASDSALVMVVIVFLFVAVMLVFLRGFSVDATLARLEAALEPAVLDEAAGDASFDQACERVARAIGLTPREQEIFALLAKGRNSPYIQEELVISYNTVRTHVRHIYEKGGFHTQQELIDRVEGERRG